MNSGYTFPPQNPDAINDAINGNETEFNVNDSNTTDFGFTTNGQYFDDQTNIDYPIIDIQRDIENPISISNIEDGSPLPMSKSISMTPTINIPEPPNSTSDIIVSTPKIIQNFDSITTNSTPDNFQDYHVNEQAEIASLSGTDNVIGNLRQQLATDWKSPSEYALHILFTKFVRQAEYKLNICLEHPLESELPIVDILGEGVDLEFDNIIDSLGHIAKNKPKPVIDAMMFWRKTKSEIALLAADETQKLMKEYSIEQTRLLRTKSTQSSQLSSNPRRSRSSSVTTKLSHARNNSSKSSVNIPSVSTNNRLKELEAQINSAKEITFQADKKSLISIYILCRVLIEIVKQSPEDADEDLNNKLEEIVFTQLKTTDPISISTSLIKSSNWNAFAELLGYMSEKKFISVSDRFVASIEKIPKQISPEIEPSVHLLILGMRYLKLKHYPMEKFEDSAEFMKSITKFFLQTNNLSTKLSYAEVISQLLLPLAGVITVEVNHPTWVKTMSSLLDEANKLQLNNKYWASGFKLAVAVLCVSPTELFTKHWLSLIESNIINLRSKSLSNKITFAVSLSRLVWVYLYRCPETLNNTTRRIKQLINLYIGNQKKKDNWITTDLELINPLCDVLVTIGYLYPTLIMEEAILPLVKQSFNGSTLNNILYEKLILAINTFKGLLLTNSRPEFPENDNRFYDNNLNNIKVEQNENLVLNNDEITSQFYKLFLLLDSNIGSEVWSPENEHQKQNSFGIGPFSFNFSNDGKDFNGNKNLNIALFATLIETIPCSLSVSKKIPIKSAIEILSRNAVHVDLLIASSSQNALKSLAAKENPYTLITWFAKYSFDFDEQTQSRYNLSYLASSEYKQLLVLYIELLECWLEEFQSSEVEEKQKETGLDGIQLPIKETETEGAKDSNKLQWKNMAAVIEEVEGNGLFFLCDNDASVRMLGIRILKIISKFDTVMVEKTSSLYMGHSRSSSHFAADRGTRLIDFLLTSDANSLLNVKMQKLSSTERTRLSKLNLRYKKGLLLKLAESDSSVDTALWQRMFPKLLSVIFLSCPVTMALCRSIVCVRLVQMHDTILKLANDISFKPDDASPEIVTEQWKLYLIVACTFLTSTNNQRLLIPDSKASKNKNKSQQIFTVQHQKIKSATSIFKMVLPLLSSESTLVVGAIIAGVSSMNINIYKSYIESIDGFISNWGPDYSLQQTRIETFHILAILSNYISDPIILNDKWLLLKLSEYVKILKNVLQDEVIQFSFEYQNLRIYFMEFLLGYYNAVKDLNNISELFPFQARTSCFNFLSEWCGFGNRGHIFDERFQSMINSAGNDSSRTAIASSLESQKPKLQQLALEGMIALCTGCITENITSDPDIPMIVSFDTSDLLSWISSLMKSEKPSIISLGVRALEGILEHNKENASLYEEVKHQCLSSNHLGISNLYYITLCKSLLKLDMPLLNPDQLVTLGLCGLVAEHADTRYYAVDLLSSIELNLHSTSFTKGFKEQLSNQSKMIYKPTAKKISSMFAELFPQELCLEIFSNMVNVLDLYESERKKDILTLLVPWVNKITLKSIEDFDTLMVLQNLFYITIELNNSIPESVEKLWISLGKGNSFQNTYVSIEYIINSSIKYRNPLFVRQAKDVILYLSNVPGSIGVIDLLLKKLEPKSMIPKTNIDLSEPANSGNYCFVADIWARLNYTGGGVLFSEVQLSIIFLSSFLSNQNESIKQNTATLLHISLCLADHYVPLVQESAKRILCDLIFSAAPISDISEKTVAVLRNKKGLWSYDDLSRTRMGAKSPKAMDLIVRNIISIFSGIPTLQVEWQRIALNWATSCSVRHVACRSFQIFRSLLTFIDQDMLRDMIHRLSNTISDDNRDIQGFAMQILMTINAITAELEPADLINYPQLFWSITACLNSVHELEFIEVLSCLNKFISKIDLDAPDTVQCLVAIFPSNWEGRFDGLQQIIMPGLRSANSCEASWKFLDKLNLLKDSRIIANSDSRLLLALISNLPRFLHAMELKDFTQIQNACNSLISLADSYSEPSLSRVIDSLAKDKFRSKKDFISQIVNFISRKYFPVFSGQTVVFFLGLLLNKHQWMKIQTIEILKHILPLIDFTLPEFTGVGADLISPLLRLLLTDLDIEALKVLDCIPDISGSKMDKDVLRISMGNKDVNERFSTTTIFGIPESTGWSVPLPSVTAATTRHNVHSVFSTFIKDNPEAEISNDLTKLDEVVEFHQDDDYKLAKVDSNETYSITEENDASLSHMWAELDNLDSFFTKNVAAASLPSSVPSKSNIFGHDRVHSIETNTSTLTSNLESAPQLYDMKVSAILNKSLLRTSSNTSFKANLADSFTTNNSSENINDSPFNSTVVNTTPELSGSRSRTSHLLRSPNSSVLKQIESPQDSLFKFEGFLRPAQRNRRKWHSYQQHQQLMSQTIHEQVPQAHYESESSPLRYGSTSPMLGLNKQKPYSVNLEVTTGKQAKDTMKQTKDTNRQTRYQKHYHIPHFSSNKG
ncbi:hypothetical protein TPHA_0C03070 [Tetrapisispora phaffii CBS 4417]|uniref:Cell morphogenesis protein PAG1 n=1 Tax=Tetrapisispora phaffii (strain ATCC 24235 / CBS 4417 / NBRC 1672 / NRRL Y-8282 / UCD 70-5) TaxID=1071381 RepID=G8BRT4_TETPH|nr:hypothetical protein TPHA_0C03070 [Tetrapisispora phaffii CBS 4417]CCE62460.1 hypothetical protein TPHA_0C03070 [Tetrapisispora phaffii CBS 4417]